MANRQPTAQFLTISGRQFLLDCAEGTQMKLRQNNIGFGRINHILISHLHGDHFYGLVPLLTTLQLLDRQADMHLYGPENLEKAVRSILEASGARIRYPLHFHHTSRSSKKLLYEDEALTVHSFPLQHRMPCCGFLFQEKERPRSMRKEKIQEYDIPVAEIRRIKRGAEFSTGRGEIISNSELTDPAPPPLSYAYCTDTAPVLSLPEIFHSVDLLYHEATFMEKHARRATETYHSTARQAATMAHKLGARHLLLGHYSARYRDLRPLREEAREIFSDSHLALDDHQFLLFRDNKKDLVEKSPGETNRHT